MLTGGAGAINNSMFTMDVNGTLRTAEIFDHESNDFLSIRVLDELYEMTSMSLWCRFKMMWTKPRVVHQLI